MGFFKKGQYGIVDLGQNSSPLAEPLLKNIELSPDRLKVVIGNMYSDEQLAGIAGGNLDAIRPVKTVLAQIILEQLKETCYVNVNGLRRALGAPLSDKSRYAPGDKISSQGMKWQDEGNLFCTNSRVVFPSNQFTFIRLGRKISAIQAFANGVAIQQKNEEYATYFVGGYPHEAALVAAYVMGKIPALRPKEKK